MMQLLTLYRVLNDQTVNGGKTINYGGCQW